MTPKLVRYRKNPILRPTKNVWESKQVFNTGTTVYRRRVLLLYRAIGQDNISRLGIALLKGGGEVQERLKEPVFVPDPKSEYETLGVEDPRITQINNTVYYVVYTAASLYPPIVPGENSRALSGLPGDGTAWRVRVSLAHTNDFREFARHGVIISHIDSKDAALFPQKFDDHYLLLHRVYPQMRLAIAPSLHEFHAHGVKERGVYLWPRPGKWDNERVGGGSQPIETPYGWLIVYHAVDHDLVYRLGFLLTDRMDPSKILIRSDEPVLEPEKTYEKQGAVSNVVFTCGAVDWNDRYLVYYGAADTTVALAWIMKADLFSWIEKELKKQKLFSNLSAAPER
jgi:predicted GH43/DUF377 family glycosyl hydrolase